LPERTLSVGYKKLKGEFVEGKIYAVIPEGMRFAREELIARLQRIVVTRGEYRQAAERWVEQGLYLNRAGQWQEK
jgi:hypothetical protein